jgi:uncharacterized membrane protein YfcA
MSVLEFTAIVGLASFAAGLLGALTGMGGGVVVVPLLVLALRVDLHYAIGASLVSVIATSSGSAAAYVREGFTNLRLGMLLEVGTTIGALVGALLATALPARSIGLVLGVVLLASAWLSARPPPEGRESQRSDPLAGRLRLDAAYPEATPEGTRMRPYHVQHVPAGFSLMFVAGALSGLLGIGAGALKVLAMDRVMKVPFKASTTTSNFMIGVTAATSAGVFLNRGYVDPALTMPVMLGVLAGSIFGARLLIRAPTRPLRLVFAAVVVFLAIEMFYSSLTGRI